MEGAQRCWWGWGGAAVCRTGSFREPRHKPVSTPHPWASRFSPPSAAGPGRMHASHLQPPQLPLGGYQFAISASPRDSIRSGPNIPLPALLCLCHERQVALTTGSRWPSRSVCVSRSADRGEALRWWCEATRGSFLLPRSHPLLPRYCDSCHAVEIMKISRPRRCLLVSFNCLNQPFNFWHSEYEGSYRRLFSDFNRLQYFYGIHGYNSILDIIADTTRNKPGQPTKANQGIS